MQLPGTTGGQPRQGLGLPAYKQIRLRAIGRQSPSGISQVHEEQDLQLFKPS